MNLVGHELAEAITIANGFVRCIAERRMTRETAIDCLAAQFAEFGATAATAEREIDALLAAPAAAPGGWTNERLPLTHQ